MSNTEQHTDLPESVETGSSSNSWRISKGALCRGREEDGTLETKQRLLGYLRRVGIHEGTLDTGEEYAKLECDIERNGEIYTIGASLKNKTNGKPTYSSVVTLAEGLVRCAPGELIQIEATAGSQKNRYGSISTYANVYKVDPKTMTPTRVRIEDDRSLVDRFDDAIDAFQKHPAFAPRPQRRADENETPEGALWHEFASLVNEGGLWPKWDAAVSTYLQMCTLIAERTVPFADPDDVPAAVWKEMITGYRESAAEAHIPEVLKAHLAAPAKKKAFA